MKFFLAFLIAIQPVFSWAQTKDFSNNKIRFGTGTSADKVLEFNLEKGSANPQIRANKTSGALEFTNDGTNYSEVGSGSGGAGGINLLLNGGFESGLTDWQWSGPTPVIVSSGPNHLYQKGTATWQATAAGNYFETKLKTVPGILSGKTCHAKIFYKGDASLYKYEVLDSANNVVWNGGAVIPALGNYPSADYSLIEFTCPDAGTQIKERITAVGSSGWGLVSFDEATLGQLTVQGTIDRSKAEFVGSAEWAGVSGCSWTATTVGSFVNYVANVSCNNPTITGVVSAASTKIPGIQLDLKAGHYLIMAYGLFYKNASTAAGVAFRFHDGTTGTTSGEIYSSTSAVSNASISGSFTYAADQGVKTIQLQGYTDTSGVGAQINADNTTDRSFRIVVYRFPTASDPKRVLLSGENALYAGETFIAPGDTCTGDSIPADGAAYLRSQYPGLFDAVGTKYGDGTTTNGGPSGYAAGTAFNVRDLRGFVPRGIIDIAPVTGTGAITSNNATFTSHKLKTGMRVKINSGTITGLTVGQFYYAIVLDSNTIAFAATRTQATAASPTKISISGTNSGVLQQAEDVGAQSRIAVSVGADTGAKSGTIEEDQVQGHYHNRNPLGEPEVYRNNSVSSYTFGSGGYNLVSQVTTGAPVTDGASGTPRTGSETQGNNAGVQFCVRTKTGKLSVVIPSVVLSKDNPDNTVINTVKVVTSSYTATVNDETIVGDSTASAFPITLPAAATNKGKKYILIQDNAGPNMIAITSVGGQICRRTTVYLSGQDDRLTVQSDGVKWFSPDGTCEITRSASIASSGGVITNIGNKQFIAGNCSIPQTYTYSCTATINVFSSITDCSAISQFDNRPPMIGAPSGNAITFGFYNTGGTSPGVVKCWGFR